MPEKIDFVLPWVDGSDTVWRNELNKYLPQGTLFDEARYRDWGLLRYWFRAVESFAPWVNLVFFVTNGQCPDWLDTKHPKLRLVKHDDYIPARHLPCFSSHPIELNMHRIPGLSEHFVYFNDDTYLMRPVSKELFFNQEGLPRLRSALESRVPDGDGIFSYINNTITLSKRFDIHACVKKDWRKWFSPLNTGPRTLIRNYMYIKHFCFTNLQNNNHLPTPYRKSLLEKVWQAEPQLLESTSSHRFRQNDDVNHWLFHNWAVASGEFFPIRPKKLGEFRMIVGPKDVKEAEGLILSQNINMLCINDDVTDPAEFETCRERLDGAFRAILPEASSFERY